LERIRDIGLPVKVNNSILLGPLPNRLKVTASMGDLGDLLGLLHLLDPPPGKRGDVRGAHETLPERVVAMLQVLDAHELVVGRILGRAVQALPEHVLRREFSVSQPWSFMGVGCVEEWVN